MTDTRTIEEQNIIDFLEKAPAVVKDNEAFIEWLKSEGFFIQAAAANHHGNYAGGLYAHSDAVRSTLENFTELNLITWDRPESPFIVGMFHDLCKIDSYSMEYDRYAESDDGKRFPIGVPHFVHNDDSCIIPGHGEKSVIYLQKWLELTSQEIACIRWHMGAFDDSKMWKYYTRAVSLDPAVLFTHTADMVASQCEGI